MKKRDELWELGMFPILLSSARDTEGLVSFPRSLVEPHERQAQINHGQSLFRLASRGGLSPAELAAVLENRHFKNMDPHEAWAVIFKDALEHRKIQFPNGCDRTAPEALRFLAAHLRPEGGEDRFNSAHLLQIADELERMNIHG